MSEQQRGFTPPVRKKIALDNGKLKLNAPCPSAPGKTSNLIWGLVANNPRITVYTGDPEDSGERNGYGKIVAAMDAPAFFILLGMIENFANGPVDQKGKMDNLNYTWFGGKRSDAPVVVSETWVGKDKEGKVFISIISGSRPKIAFYFQPPQFHQLCSADGTPLDRGQASVLAAKGYANLLKNMMSNMLVSEYVEPPPPKDRNGGSGGGNNYGGANRSGGTQRQTPTEAPAEDYPF